MASPEELVAYKDALIVLGTASVIVPLVVRFRISPILGFLLAGALLGPKGLGALAGVSPIIDWLTITNGDSLTRIAELGVVFLLFLIGLELSLPRLLTMRRLVFGLGSLQVVVSTLLIGGALAYLGFSLEASLVIGAALALSSTAIVLELLARQRRLATVTGRTTFAVLLLQDLAVVPILFLVGILGSREGGSLFVGLALAIGQAAVVIAVIVVVGRGLLRPLFRAVAITDSHELFVAATLFVAVGASIAAAASGLSMALGAFIAGLLLAESEYRRAIEAVVEPFKGLLLGVFFFSVGMSLDLVRLLASPFWPIAATLALIVLKFIVAAGLIRLFRAPWAVAVEGGLLLGPSGEFAFVVVALAVTQGLVPDATAEQVLAVAALAMALLPPISFLARRFARHLEGALPPDPAITAEPPADLEVGAIVVGYGRVGTLVSSLLEKHGVRYVATDRDPIVIGRGRREGQPLYYGDARQATFLERCGIRSARAVIITIHTQPEIDEIVRVVRSLCPAIVIVSRARDAGHARHLYDLGVTDAVPETIEASLQLSEAALAGLGVPAGPVIASIHEKRDEFRRDLRKEGIEARLRTGEPGRS
jgi:CPA2 family monovalent cation:H+ antiporter-2